MQSFLCIYWLHNDNWLEYWNAIIICWNCILRLEPLMKYQIWNLNLRDFTRQNSKNVNFSSVYCIDCILVRFWINLSKSFWADWDFRIAQMYYTTVVRCLEQSRRRSMMMTVVPGRFFIRIKDYRRLLFVKIEQNFELSGLFGLFISHSVFK